MAKWTFAALILFSVTAEAHEAHPEQQEDGCAILEQLIYEEVTAVSWGMTGSDTELRKFDAPGVVVCMDTTLATSKAFATAMQTVGQAVTWNLPIDPGMEACLGGDIEECITTPSPWLPATRFDGNWQISSVWDAVNSAVRQAMPRESAPNYRAFSRDALRHAVRAAVRRPR